MPEHRLRGLELAIYLKSNLLRQLAASPLDEWPRHLAQFVTRLEASNLQDATALVVLLADLREQIRVLVNAISENAGAAAVDVRALMRMSRDDVMAWFRGEYRALLAGAHPVFGPRSRLVDEAVRFIDRHYAEPLTIDRIANAVGASKRHLGTVFRRQVGQSLHQYLTYVRLHRGMALIREGQKIQAVSLMVGYRSRKDFYRHFKAAVGMTPLTYKITCLQP